MNLKGKKALVVGAGKSGRAAARFLVEKGCRTVLTDSGSPEKLGTGLDHLAGCGVELVLGEYPCVQGAGFDLVVMSPGVPLGILPVTEARLEGIPVIGELELAYRFAGSPIIAVTGTNGKTTTTTLLGEIFKEAGHRVLVAGNIGVTLVDAVESYGPRDIIVAEVSSFQLETVEKFRPRVGLILNLTPDHLDRHGDMAGYAAAKGRISMNQQKGDFLVLNYDDPLTREMKENGGAKVIYFSRRHILEEGVFVRNNTITARLAGEETTIMEAEKLLIPGAHNLENALAAVAAGLVMGVPAGSMARTMAGFSGVAHRLETVTEIDGVKYVNDSKGTNPDASIKAVEAFAGPLVLIAGGRNKGNDFTDFMQLAAPKTRALVVLGECAEEIDGAARGAGIKNILRAGGFREAVLMASSAARAGDVVLLSPACASWDMFKSYEERGDLFKEIVRELKGG